MSGLSDGAKAGAAFGPWGAAIGGAAGLAGDIANSPTGPMLSGAPVDARSFMDGSGWTVSTGRASATGADIQRGDAMPASGADWSSPAGGTLQAGFGGASGLLLLLLAGGLLLVGKR